MLALQKQIPFILFALIFCLSISPSRAGGLGSGGFSHLKGNCHCLKKGPMSTTGEGFFGKKFTYENSKTTNSKGVCNSWANDCVTSCGGMNNVKKFTCKDKNNKGTPVPVENFALDGSPEPNLGGKQMAVMTPKPLSMTPEAFGKATQDLFHVETTGSAWAALGVAVLGTAWVVLTKTSPQTATACLMLVPTTGLNQDIKFIPRTIPPELSPSLSSFFESSIPSFKEQYSERYTEILEELVPEAFADPVIGGFFPILNDRDYQLPAFFEEMVRMYNEGKDVTADEILDFVIERDIWAQLSRAMSNRSALGGESTEQVEALLGCYFRQKAEACEELPKEYQITLEHLGTEEIESVLGITLPAYRDMMRVCDRT